MKLPGCTDMKPLGDSTRSKRGRHLNRAKKDYRRSDSGGLFMLVTKTGSKLRRCAYSFDAKQKLLALGQYPVTSLADARIKRDDAKGLLAEGIDFSINRKEERRNARMARASPRRWIILRLVWLAGGRRR